MNGGIIHDESPLGRSVGNTNVSVVMDDPDFPHGAFNFPSNLASVVSTNGALDFGEADFTIEFDYKSIGAQGGYPEPFSSGPFGQTGSIAVYDGHASTPSVVAVSVVSTFPFLSGTPRSIGVRRQLALSRTSSVLRLFIDGVLAASATCTNPFFTTSGLRFGDGANYFRGNMGRIRVTQGVGRYVANYTPSNTPWPTA